MCVLLLFRFRLFSLFAELLSSSVILQFCFYLVPFSKIVLVIPCNIWSVCNLPWSIKTLHKVHYLLIFCEFGLLRTNGAMFAILLDMQLLLSESHTLILRNASVYFKSELPAVKFLSSNFFIQSPDTSKCLQIVVVFA